MSTKRFKFKLYEDSLMKQIRKNVTCVDIFIGNPEKNLQSD